MMDLRTRGSARRLAPLLYLILATLPSLSFGLHFRGHVVLGWDSIPPIRPDLLLHSSLSAWDGRAYLGQSDVFSLTALPLALIALGLTKIFGVIGADRITLTFLFVLPAFTMYYAARSIYPRFPWVWFLSGWFYALSPLLFARFYVPIYSVALTYALTPLLVLGWVTLTQATKPLAVRLLFFALVEVLFSPCGRNLAFWLAPHVLAVGLVAILPLNGQGNCLHRLRLLSLGLLVTVLLNSFWLMPQMIFGVASGPALENQTINRSYSDGVRRDVAENSSLAYTLRLSSRAMTDAGDEYGPYWTYARALLIGPVAAVSYIWVVLSLSALAVRRKDLRALCLGAFLVLSLYVMKGTSPPFAEALQGFNSIPILGTIFRDGYDKMISVASFCIAILTALSLQSLCVRRKHARLAQLSAVVAALVLAFPYWTGQMFMARGEGPTLSSIPPSELLRFSKRIDGLPGRLLFVPTSPNSLLLSTTWGFYGPNIYGSLTDAPFIAGRASTLNLADVNELVSAVYSAIGEQDALRFLELARDLGIRYVFVAKDVDSKYYGDDTSLKDIQQFLHGLSGVKSVQRVGPYELLQILPSAPKAMSLEQVPVAGYKTPFTTALALEKYCGSGDVVLIWAAHGACNIEPVSAFNQRSASNTFKVLETVKTEVSVSRGRLLGYMEGEDKTQLFSVGLPLGSEIEIIGGDVVVGKAPVSLVLTAGLPQRIESYAIEAGRWDLHLGGLLGSEPSMLGHSFGEITAQSSQPTLITAPLTHMSPEKYLVTVRVASRDAEYQMSIIDETNKVHVATSRMTASATASVTFRAKASHSYMVRVDLTPESNDATFKLRELFVAPIRMLGSKTFSIPRIEPAIGATGAIRVSGISKRRATPINGQVAAVSAPTALVLNTQYDPMWFALLNRPSSKLPILLPHVVGDGFKNAWFIPAKTRGQVHVFYLPTAMWLVGIFTLCATIVLITILALMSLIRMRHIHVRV